MNQQEVAKVLQDSGLFGWVHPVDVCDKCGQSGTYAYPDPSICIECGCTTDSRQERHPTADQSEAILWDMKLQVVRSAWIQDWCLGMFESNWPEASTFDVIKRLDCGGQRTLANNAALAWLCQQEAWKPKLQAALERMGLL